MGNEQGGQQKQLVHQRKYDYLHLLEDSTFQSKIMSEYPRELFLFSANVQKYRDEDNEQQARDFVVTSGAVYNLQTTGYFGAYLKRRIAIKDIDCLSLSNQSNQCVIHVPDEQTNNGKNNSYDYRISHQSHIFKFVEAVVNAKLRQKAQKKAKKKFRIYYHDDLDLLRFQKTKIDKSNGVKGNKNSLKGESYREFTLKDLINFHAGYQAKRGDHLLDYLNVLENPTFLKYFTTTYPNEQIKLTCNMEKYNHRGKRQARNLLVTSKALYNLEQYLDSMKLFQSSMIKRRILLSKIEALYVSKYSFQFVIAVPSEYDYIFDVQKYRTKILEAIVEGCLALSGKKKIRVYFLDKIDLQPFVTFENQARNIKIDSCPFKELNYKELMQEMDKNLTDFNARAKVVDYDKLEQLEGWSGSSEDEDDDDDQDSSENDLQYIINDDSDGEHEPTNAHLDSWSDTEDEDQDTKYQREAAELKNSQQLQKQIAQLQQQNKQVVQQQSAQPPKQKVTKQPVKTQKGDSESESDDDEKKVAKPQPKVKKPAPKKQKKAKDTDSESDENEDTITFKPKTKKPAPKKPKKAKKAEDFYSDSDDDKKVAKPKPKVKKPAPKKKAKESGTDSESDEEKKVVKPKKKVKKPVPQKQAKSKDSESESDEEKKIAKPKKKVKKPAPSKKTKSKDTESDSDEEKKVTKPKKKVKKKAPKKQTNSQDTESESDEEKKVTKPKKKVKKPAPKKQTKSQDTESESDEEKKVPKPKKKAKKPAPKKQRRAQETESESDEEKKVFKIKKKVKKPEPKIRVMESDTESESDEEKKVPKPKKKVKKPAPKKRTKAKDTESESDEEKKVPKPKKKVKKPAPKKQAKSQDTESESDEEKKVPKPKKKVKKPAPKKQTKSLLDTESDSSDEKDIYTKPKPKVKKPAPKKKTKSKYTDSESESDNEKKVAKRQPKVKKPAPKKKTKAKDTDSDSDKEKKVAKPVKKVKKPAPQKKTKSKYTDSDSDEDQLIAQLKSIVKNHSRQKQTKAKDTESDSDEEKKVAKPKKKVKKPAPKKKTRSKYTDSDSDEEKEVAKPKPKVKKPAPKKKTKSKYTDSESDDEKKTSKPKPKVKKPAPKKQTKAKDTDSSSDDDNIYTKTNKKKTPTIKFPPQQPRKTPKPKTVKKPVQAKYKQQLGCDSFETVRSQRTNFGVSIIARMKSNKKLYRINAYKMKCVDKAKLPKYIQKASFLQNNKNPYVFTLKFAFKSSSNKLFIGSNYFPGGTLDQVLKCASGKRFNESRVKEYASQITLGLSYLHKYKMVHGDLTPEAIGLDAEGFLCIRDFSKQKIVKNAKKSSLVSIGTPEYMAPERIFPKFRFKGMTGLEADWYSLGVMIYQMLFGYCPFERKGKRYINDTNNFWNAVGTQPVEFPDDIFVSDTAKDLIIQLLQKEPAKRLGVKGYRSVRKHKFFKTISFTNILYKKIKPSNPPYIRQLRKQYIKNDPLKISKKAQQTNTKNLYGKQQKQQSNSQKVKLIAKAKHLGCDDEDDLIHKKHK